MLAFVYRVVLVLLALRYLPFPLTALPFGGLLAQWYTAAWNHAIVWTSTALTGAPTSVVLNGSGDRLYDYLQLLWQVVLSVAIAWAWRARERRGRSSLHLAHLRLYLRYALGSVMIGYGIAKIFPWQFPEPSWFELERPVGELSPMGLLWTFMGVSRPYTIAAGLSELIAGTFLFFSRSTPLGALFVAAIMSHVVLLNFCYDVPVKLYALTYWLTALVLLAPVLKQLYTTLLPAGEPANPYRRWATYAPLVVLVLVAGGSLSPLWTSQGQASDSALTGFYDVTQFVSATDEPAWQRVELRTNVLLAGKHDGSRQIYTIEPSRHASAGTLILRPYPGARPSEIWKLTQDGDRIALRRLGQREVTLRLQRGRAPKPPLLTRGFHWINERPPLH